MGVNGARYVALIRGLVGIFMFGVQTFFISKSVGYLFQIFISSINANFLNQEIFLLFFMGMNLIDGAILILVLLIQYFLFSQGQYFYKSFINFSAFFVYFGLILFLIIIISENYQELSKLFKVTFNYENFFAKSNVVP